MALVPGLLELAELQLRRAAEHAVALLKDLPFRLPKYRHIEIHGVVPDREFSETLEFDPAKTREAFEAGREAAKSRLTEEELQQRLGQ